MHHNSKKYTKYKDRIMYFKALIIPIYNALKIVGSLNSNYSMRNLLCTIILLKRKEENKLHSAHYQLTFISKDQLDSILVSYTILTLNSLNPII